MGHARKQQLSIFITTDCNLNCKYCQLSTGKRDIKDKDQIIDFRFACRGIEDFFRDFPSRSIRFYSAGEVTTQMDSFKRIVDFVKAKDERNLFLELQTNGYFSEKNADWIEENMDLIWISFDGLPEYQDTNRPTIDGGESSTIVIRNLIQFSKSKKTDVGCRVTLTYYMFSRQRDIIDFLCNIGIKYISIERAYTSVGKFSFVEENTDPEYFAERFLDAHNYAKSKGIFYTQFCMVNFDEPSRFFCRSCIPYPQLTTDGYVSCCDMAPFGKPEYLQYSLKDLIFGRYDPDNDLIIYDEEKIFNIRQRNSHSLSLGACKGCEFVSNCAGGCLGQSYNHTGKICSKCDWNCAVTKYLAERMPRNQGLYPIEHS
jgi:radical SAM protein with 4Fe4S-binding SPASM domain